jgi:hypothetical protein
MHLQRWLTGTLRQDLAHTEDAMRIGAHSSELWLWKAMLGAYAIAKIPLEASDEQNNDDEGEDEAENLSRSANRMMISRTPQSSGRSSPTSSSSDLAGLDWWFAEKIRSWSSVARVRSWEDAKKALGRIAWPENFSDDNALAGLWNEAMDSADQ